MTCRDFEARADAYAEGRLSGPEAAAFEAHLNRCAACAAALERAAGPPPGLAALARQTYDGDVMVGEDLMSFDVGDTVQVRRPGAR